MKQVGGECPLQGIMPTGKGTPGQEARVFLAFNVLLPLNKGKKCIYALRESSKAWQVIWVFPDGHFGFLFNGNLTKRRAGATVHDGVSGEFRYGFVQDTRWDV